MAEGGQRERELATLRDPLCQAFDLSLFLARLQGGHFSLPGPLPLGGLLHLPKIVGPATFFLPPRIALTSHANQVGLRPKLCAAAMQNRGISGVSGGGFIRLICLISLSYYLYARITYDLPLGLYLSRPA